MATEAAVRAELEALGASLVIVSTYTPSSVVASGDVISMDPPVGTLVAPGSTVTLLVSLGPPAASRWTGNQPEIVEAALEAPQHAAIISCFVYLDVVDQPLYAGDAGMDIKWNGQTWLGLGQFGSIDAVSESLELYAQPLKLTLSGVDPAVLPEVSQADYKYRDAKIYLGVFDPYTYELLDEPEEYWSGFMDVLTKEGDRNLSTWIVNCEHDLLRQPKVSRWTDEDQRLRFPEDTSFEHLHEIVGYVAKWGARDVGFGGGDSPGRKGRGHVREF